MDDIAGRSVMLRHLPNLLSGFRLLAAPLTAWAILAEHDGAALAVFAGAGLSDFADGFIARSFRFTSRFGAWLDPIADKLLMLLCFLSLYEVGAAPLWLVALVIARDAIIAGGAVLAKALRLSLRIRPLLVGKAATASEVAYVGVLLFLLAIERDAPLLLRGAGYLVAAFVLLSGLAYLYVFLRALLTRPRKA
jgi:cardiolipin synthase